MRWDDTDWVKLYRPPSWSRFWKEVSLEARGLFWALLLAVDKAGLMDCGVDVVGSVCGAVNGNPDRLPVYLDELTADGCVVVTRSREGRYTLVVPNFIEAQTARSSDAKRKAQSRARARENALEQRDRRQLSMPPGVVGSSVSSHTVRHRKSHDDMLSCDVADVVSQITGHSKDSKDSKDSSPAISCGTEYVDPPPAGAPGSPEWDSLRVKVRCLAVADKDRSGE